MALTLTIAFSSHRPETLPAAEKLMADHDHIVIEEPPTPEFRQMLAGAMSVADFLLTADYEFPAFAEASCRMLRRLHQAGKGIHPCEPFMTRLVRIHEDFARGVRPADLSENGRRWPVYQAEREAEIDSLTGLANRRFIEERLDDLIGQLAARDEGGDDRLRDELMPVNRRYPLADLMAACYLLYPLVFNLALFDYHPEVIAVPVLAGNKSYLDWIDSSIDPMHSSEAD